jgi:Methyltransferase domain
MASCRSGKLPVGPGHAALLRSGAFDPVVAYMCLHDMDRMAAAVAEADRVLEPGRLCAVIPRPVNSAGGFQGRGPDAPFLIEGPYLDTASGAGRSGRAAGYAESHRPDRRALRPRSHRRHLHLGAGQEAARHPLTGKQQAAAAGKTRGRWGEYVR